MKRRTIIAGVGGLVASGGLAFSSSAFSTVDAQRRVTVKVADDYDALLTLKQLGEGERSDSDGTPQQVEFSFPGDHELIEDSDLGLGTNSIYVFDQDAEEANSSAPTEGLLRIRNRGNQSINVYSLHNTDSDLTIELFDVTDSDGVALRDEPAVLDVGDKVDVGFRIRTSKAGLGTFDETLKIIGEAT